MRNLKINAAKVEAVLGTIVVTVLAVLPAIENADWKSTAGSMSGALAVAGIVGVRLLGHQKWDKIVADYGPKAAIDLRRASELLKGGSDAVAKELAGERPVVNIVRLEGAGEDTPGGRNRGVMPFTPSDVSEDMQAAQLARQEADAALNEDVGDVEHPDSAELPEDEPVDPDKGDSRSKAAKAAKR